MLKIKSKRSLTLTTQTLRVLDTTELRVAAGGTRLVQTERTCLAPLTELCWTE
jgi:hypothetical protein